MTMLNLLGVTEEGCIVSGNNVKAVTSLNRDYVTRLDSYVKISG